MKIKFYVNDKLMELDVAEDKRLIDILRYELKLTSLKEGCGEGECGACTIFFNSKLVNSCLILATQIDGAKIYTLEGLAKEAEKIKKAFIKKEAIQCGFCTSGFILKTVDYMKSNSSSKQEDIKKALDGNLCRCGGYYNIIEAIEYAMKKLN